MLNLLKNLVALMRLYFRSPYYGFVYGHEEVSLADLQEVRAKIGVQDDKIVEKFERGYAALIGQGEAVSFAAARMGFFAVLKTLQISRGDEVVLPAATCSVMINAVLRVGATPIFADVDPVTFGSSVEGIKKVLTQQSRLVIAQHSFGIPCDIYPIVKLMKEKNIFLLEDCALTLGSKINGVTCGDFGDAALFSTDHSKPLNTMTGGLIYSNNTMLIDSLRKMQAAASELALDKQNALFDQIIFERKYVTPSRYGKFKLLSILQAKLKRNHRPFLDEDFSLSLSSSYPYPARLPTFLALLGVKMVEMWPKILHQRKERLNRLLPQLEKRLDNGVLDVYRDKRLDVVPLRVTWLEDNSIEMRNRLSSMIDVSWIWFKQPIVATILPLERFGYHAELCPNAEFIGDRVINVPCVFSSDDEKGYIENISAVLSDGDNR